MDYMYAIAVGRSNNSPNITMEAYKKYCAIFALDLEADACNSSHIHESKSGSIDVSLAFRAAPQDNLTVCFFHYMTIVSLSKGKKENPDL